MGCEAAHLPLVGWRQLSVLQTAPSLFGETKELIATRPRHSPTLSEVATQGGVSQLVELSLNDGQKRHGPVRLCGKALFDDVLVLR